MRYRKMRGKGGYKFCGVKTVVAKPMKKYVNFVADPQNKIYL